MMPPHAAIHATMPISQVSRTLPKSPEKMKKSTAIIENTPTTRLSVRRLTLMSRAWAATENV